MKVTTHLHDTTIHIIPIFIINITINITETYKTFPKRKLYKTNQKQKITHTHKSTIYFSQYTLIKILNNDNMNKLVQYLKKIHHFHHNHSQQQQEPLK